METEYYRHKMSVLPSLYWFLSLDVVATRCDLSLYRVVVLTQAKTIRGARQKIASRQSSLYASRKMLQLSVFGETLIIEISSSGLAS